MSCGRIVGLLLLLLAVGTSWEARAQSFGIELHNSMMPASGGMAGASISRPQDLQSAINANPATLSQFLGTQVAFGGGWADVNYRVDQLAPLPLVSVSPYSATSGTPGALLGNIGVTQDFRAFDLPVTAGIGLISNAGAGVDFRGIPASHGTSAQYLALDMIGGAGVQLTEQLSLGGSLQIGTSFLDGPFVDISGMVPAYGVRGSIGANYWIAPCTSVGAYWQSKKHFTFDDAALFPGGNSVDVAFDHPENVGLGVANNRLLDGRLLLAFDVLFKRYSQADFLSSIYKDQWVYLFGTQYAITPGTRLRLGYSFNQNPMRDVNSVSIGGVTLPDGVPAMRYVQGQFAAISQHRITAGVGKRDMLPGVDVDLFAGYAFDATDRFAATQVNISGNYWVGFGLTWRFGGCPPDATAAAPAPTEG